MVARPSNRLRLWVVLVGGLALALGVIPLLFSCAGLVTQTGHYRGITRLLQKGDFPAAVQAIEKARDTGYDKKSRVLYHLDMGMVLHYGGDYEASNNHFETAEQTMEELYTRRISRATLSMLLNDNVLDYRGEDYENLYVNVFKALNYCQMDQLDEALVEIRRVNEKLELLADKYNREAAAYNRLDEAKVPFKAGTSRFHNSALARYLSMLLYRAEGEMDDSRIDQDKIKRAWRDQSHIYNFALPKAVDKALQPEQGKARLDVVAFAGFGPKKEAKILYIHTKKNLVGIYTASTARPNARLDLIRWPVEAGHHYKFALPYIEERPSRVKSIGVTVNGQKLGHLELLEDMSQVAVAVYKVKEPLIYLKSITRSLLKGIAGEQLKARLKEEEKKNKDKSKKEDQENPGKTVFNWLARAAVDVGISLTENADLRGWRTMPGRCFVGEFLVEAGAYEVRVDYYSRRGTPLGSFTFPNQEITTKGPNIVETVLLL